MSDQTELREQILALDGVPTEPKYENDVIIMTTDRKIAELVAAAEQRARISEQARPITYHLNADATEDYKAGFREAARQADASGELRLAELEQSLRKEQE